MDLEPGGPLLEAAYVGLLASVLANTTGGRGSKRKPSDFIPWLKPEKTEEQILRDARLLAERMTMQRGPKRG